jgi:hypothetical protein
VSVVVVSVVVVSVVGALVAGDSCIYWGSGESR